jgi:hypothetical protein
MHGRILLSGKRAGSRAVQFRILLPERGIGTDPVPDNLPKCATVVICCHPLLFYRDMPGTAQRIILAIAIIF